MPSSRLNLTLDEQSFQGLLSAAFIIQEHNDQRKRAGRAPTESEAERVGQQGEAPQAGDASGSESSGLEELRPGERLQHKWASMWLMSQEQGLWPECSAEIREGAQEGSPATESRRTSPRTSERTTERTSERTTERTSERTTEAILKDLAPEDLTREDADADGERFGLSTSDEFSPILSVNASAEPSSWRQRLADGRVKVRFRRADLYLGTAIFVAALALLWPAAGSPRRAALSPWERALVTIGIAEAPAPVMIHLQGDPGIEVWVDPHSALYYCPGEEQYGKTVGGRLSRQRDAQMDRFEPAGRSACE